MPSPDVIEPRVRETSLTQGTGDIVLAGAMRGSLAFDEVMSMGETCDICISYDNTFEECEITFQANGDLQRGTVYRSRHANGTVDQNHVSFAIGVKTVILVYGSARVFALFNGALRYDEAQSLSAPQKLQAQANMGGIQTAGVRTLFHMTTPPVGWTKDTSINDKGLRVTSGTVGSGGSSAFSTVFGKTATDNFTLLATHLPAHQHDAFIGDDGHFHSVARNLAANQNFGDNSANQATSSGSTDTDTKSTGVKVRSTAGTASGADSKTGSIGSGTAHAHPMDLRLQYVDVIIATKD